TAKAGPLNCADMHEDIVSAIVGLYKAKALLAIEPLDSTCRHFLLQSEYRVTITRFRFNWSMSLGRARRPIQKGTAANRMPVMYGFRQQNSSTRRNPHEIWYCWG